MKTNDGSRARSIGLVLWLACCPLTLFAQTERAAELDSLIDRCHRIEHGTPDQARILADEILERLQDRDDPARRARAIGCQGWSAAALGDLETAERATAAILELIPEMNDDAPSKLAALRRASALRQRTGQVSASIELLDQAMILAESSGQEAELASLYTALGVAHSEAGNHSAAIAHYEQALQRVEAGADPALRMPILYNLGLTLRGAGDNQRAYDVLLGLVEPLQQPGLEIRLASLYSVLGSISRQLGRVELARDWLQKSESLHQNLDNPAEYTALLIDRSRLELEHGDRDEAARLAEAALAEARRSGYYHSLRGALDLNVELLQRFGRDAEALALLHEYVELSERDMREQRASELAQVEARLGRETQARELAEARADAQARSLALRRQQARQRWALFGGVLVLLVLLGAFAWQRASYRALHRVSRTDLLTGLRNRRGITSLFDQRAWPPADGTGAMMLIDLDHFKQVNDRFGHDRGDAVLREVAQALQQQVKALGGKIARWGGEEFLLLLPARDAATAAAYAEQLCATVRALSPRGQHGETIPTSVSIGFSPLSSLHQMSGQEPWEPAFLVADHMLYRAKRGGRNRWSGVWTSVDTSVSSSDSNRKDIDPHRLDEQIDHGEIQMVEGN